MKQILYKTLVRSKSSFVIKASSAIVGIYAGYLLWYMVTQYFSEIAAYYGLLVSFISVLSCTFLAVYYLPNQFCVNRYIKDVLHYPVTTQTILCTLLIRMIVVQFGICIAMAYPQFFFCSNSWLCAMKNILVCLVVICAIDFMIILLSVIISRVFSNRIVGYAFVVFQYVSFLFLAVFTGDIIAFGFIRPDFLSWINGRIDFINIFLFVILLAIILGIAMTMVFNCWYIKGYLNIQNFHKQVPAKRASAIQIQHPYFLIEWKRVLRNKELIFFSNFKNVLTIVVLCHLLVQNFGQIAFGEKYVVELFLLMSCCGTNTISSTAYSSDSNRMYYAFLPISSRQMFLWKTIQGFLWSEIMVFLFGFVIIMVKDIPMMDVCLLFLYGTFMNYACSWIGVFLDFKMPRTTNSTNELLHGNISKVIVLIVSTAITIGEFYLVSNKIVAIPLLHLSVVISVFIIGVEMCYWLFCKGAFYDTGK